MYSQFIQQQLITARIDDVRRARHGQAAGRAAAVNRASIPPRHGRPRFPRARVIPRFAH
jgi:hypothetical protein